MTTPQPITGPIENPTWADIEGQPFELFWLKFQRTANSLAIRYGGKVYLVGSALTKEAPRDYDIRIIIPQRERRRQFGETGLYRLEDGTLTETNRSNMDAWSTAKWRQSYEGLRRNREMEEMGFVYPFDIQIMDEAMDVNFKKHPRIRMDAMPDEWIEWDWPEEKV